MKEVTAKVQRYVGTSVDGRGFTEMQFDPDQDAVLFRDKDGDEIRLGTQGMSVMAKVLSTFVALLKRMVGGEVVADARPPRLAASQATIALRRLIYLEQWKSLGWTRKMVAGIRSSKAMRRRLPYDRLENGPLSSTTLRAVMMPRASLLASPLSDLPKTRTREIGTNVRLACFFRTPLFSEKRNALR